MREIKLTKGQVAVVDDSDFNSLSEFKWHASEDGRTGKFYARRKTPVDENGRQGSISMQRHLSGARRGQFADHVNGNTLDNRRENIRLATRSQNGANRRGAASHSKTGVRGVSLKGSRYSATITVDGTRKHLGYYATAKEAGAAYAEANKKFFGEFGGTL